MLVLRRRPSEAILFDGGLRMTLVALDEHRAWLSFEAPSMPTAVVLTALSVHDAKARLGIRWPRQVDIDGDVVTVHTTAPPAVVVGSAPAPADLELSDGAGPDGAARAQEGREHSLSGTLSDVGEDAAVLAVTRQVGERICFNGMTITLQAVDADRAVLRVTVADLAGPVGVSIFSVTGAEAKIGIDAPREVRVFREEVWRELETANTEAAASWSDADLASLSTSRRRS